MRHYQTNHMFVCVLAGPTTFEGIANSPKLAKDAVATPAGSGPPKSGQSSAQDTGPATKDCTDERQPDGNLESALSRLGGMLESAGPLTDQACSQLEAPAGQSLVSALAGYGSHTCLWHISGLSEAQCSSICTRSLGTSLQPGTSCITSFFAVPLVTWHPACQSLALDLSVSVVSFVGHAGVQCRSCIQQL